MTDAKHTPGPWTIQKCPCGHPSCNQYTICTQGSVGFSEPDARLIAAAPDLLEALEAIATGRDKDGMKVDFPQDIARAAIAKATE